MQPTYLPWLGYFDLIDQADHFVVLDDVAFSRQSWQQRNRVRTAAGLSWLTVPVRRAKVGSVPICEVEISGNQFTRKHWRTIEQAYSKATHFAQYREGLHDVFLGLHEWRSLASLNIALMDWMLEGLGIQTPRSLASALNCGGSRGEHVAELCSAVDATHYLSPTGAESYLREDAKFFLEREIRISLQDYRHPRYAQLHRPFLPCASALDLLFNRGNEALEVLREGRRPNRPLDLRQGVLA